MQEVLSTGNPPYTQTLHASLLLPHTHPIASHSALDGVIVGGAEAAAGIRLHVTNTAGVDVRVAADVDQEKKLLKITISGLGPACSSADLELLASESSIVFHPSRCSREARVDIQGDFKLKKEMMVAKLAKKTATFTITCPII